MLHTHITMSDEQQSPNTDEQVIQEQVETPPAPAPQEPKKTHVELLNEGEVQVRLAFNKLVEIGDIKTLWRGTDCLATAMLLAKAALPREIPQEAEEFLQAVYKLQERLLAMQEIDKTNLQMLANANEELIKSKLWVLRALEIGPALRFDEKPADDASSADEEMVEVPIEPTV